MEFTLSNFAERLAQLIHSSKLIPDMGSFYTNKYGYTQSDASKHSKRPQPRDLRSQISNSISSSFVMGENFATFDIGNEQMEKNFPYYHILQEAPTIRKAYKSTVKTRGSEYGKSAKEIDYERVHWNGKTFTKEYQKNVRGSRVNLSKTQMHLDGQFINEGSIQYLNMHYKYLDRIADEVANTLASEFNLKIGRKQDTGLIEEFAMQEGMTVENVLAAFESFM